MRTITITNQKGGVGKTTTAHVMAAGLARRGFRVLAVDSDPQTNFTFTTGIDLENVRSDLYSLYRQKAFFSQDMKKTSSDFDLIPGSLNLAGADMEFTQAGREYILKEILQPYEKKYDYCIIDTPPTLGILTVNALTASDCIIVPMGADIYSLQGLSQLQGMIKNVRKYCNPGLNIDGLLLTKYSPRAVINRKLKDSLDQVAGQLDTKLYKTCIREAVAVKESQFLRSDIFTEYPNANITKDYNAFIDEFLGKEV